MDRSRGLRLLSAFLLLLAAPDVPQELPEHGVQLAQVTIEQRVIIRVPLSRPPKRAPVPVAPPVSLREKKGPKCLEMKDIRAASVISLDSLMLATEDGDRYRARMERGCRATDFYSGFYMEPGRDGELCAGRDSLQARSGVECTVMGFTRIVEDK